MKRNKKYMFLTAEELAHKLTYGKKKSYDFTFDDSESIASGYEPTGWFGIKLMQLFDGYLPNCLAIGYWGGGDLKVYNLEWDYEQADHVTKAEHMEKLMVKYINEYFADNDATIACVEL